MSLYEGRELILNYVVSELVLTLGTSAFFNKELSYRGLYPLKRCAKLNKNRNIWVPSLEISRTCSTDIDKKIKLGPGLQGLVTQYS